MGKNNPIKRIPREESSWVNPDKLAKFLYRYNYDKTAIEWKIKNPDGKTVKVPKRESSVLGVISRLNEFAEDGES